MKKILAIPRALYHWARLTYYTAALDCVDYAYHNMGTLSLRALESQRVLNKFLATRPRKERPDRRGFVLGVVLGIGAGALLVWLTAYLQGGVL